MKSGILERRMLYSSMGIATSFRACCVKVSYTAIARSQNDWRKTKGTDPIEPLTIRHLRGQSA
jgi:hypothetical protein